MRLLLIDNGSPYLEQLQALCARHDVITVTATDLTDEAVAAADAVVVTGGYGQDAYGQDFFLRQVSMIRTIDKPVLGICLGFELICYAYGCQLHEEAERETGAAAVTPTGEGAKLFQGTDPIRVNESPRWNVDELPKDLVVLARSESGIEAVRHRAKPIYGLQLHPGDFRYASDGKLVFDNILDTFRRLD